MVENIPVELLYASGYAALSEVDEILLLKVLKSIEERKPLVVSVDWLRKLVESEVVATTLPCALVVRRPLMIFDIAKEEVVAF